MSRQPKSRSVSWDDESLTICSSNAEYLYSNQDCDGTLSDVYSFYEEAGVENMTPFEFGCYSRRMWYIEKISLLLRDICFGEDIVDHLPEKKIKSMDESFESLYKPFPLDRQTIKWLPGQPNKALRWRVMSQIWRLLREYIFDQLTITDKDPEFDPVLTVMRDIVAEKIKQFVEPFKATTGTAANRDLDSKIDDVVRVAKVLFRMLHYDSANYSFYDVKDQSHGESLLLYSQLINAVQKVDICGAAHRDASKDLVCITASPGLLRHVGRYSFLEKKAGALLHRPGPRSGILEALEA
ncbi:hypothetical protein GGI43DRAFT_290262 [Trichoderma evansii]